MGPPPGRLVGLDAARCIALVGMVATHLHDERTVADGRASALFAVLAGVSLALMTRDRRGPRDLAGIAVRALLIGALGLWLGGLGSGLAVILTYYGLLFLLGLPLVFLRARTLAVLAAAWVLAGPGLTHVVVSHLPERGYASPAFDQLSDPGQLLGELLFTGYYPAVPWLAYLLAGLALGRADLRDPRLLGVVTAGGLGVALPATRLSIEPHSGTPADLAATIASALLVIGACLLLARVLPRPGVVALTVGTGAGAMTLTLYSLHVVLRTPDVWPPDDADAFLLHAGVLLAIGAAFATVSRRGPLETVVGWPRRLLAAKEQPAAR